VELESSGSLKRRCENRDYHGPLLIQKAMSRRPLYSCNSSAFQCDINERKQSFLSCTDQGTFVSLGQYLCTGTLYR
jgi:hypothetical protein